MKSGDSTITPLRIDTSLVRTLGIVAIVNSHMENYYPRPELAIGGLVGLALFFMATGMGINASRNTRVLPFPSWFGMRILRIHPSVIVSALLIQVVLFGAWREWEWNAPLSSNPYVDNFIYPLSTYHFLNKIFVYYIPLYFYVRWNWKRKHVAGIFGCCLLCVITAVPDIRQQLASEEPLQTGFLREPFLWSVFFFMTLLGVWVSDCPALFRRRSNWKVALVVATSGTLYLACKYTMAKLGIFTEGFLLLYAIGILSAISLVVALSNERLLERCYNSHAIIRWSTIGIGTISLEIYLVHTQFYMHRVGRSFSFPVSFMLFIAASLVGAIIVYWGAGVIRNAVHKLVR